MKFRAIQGLTTGTMFFYWITRLFSNPAHLHTTMLIMTVMVGIMSEVGYRAGKAEKEASQTSKR